MFFPIDTIDKKGYFGTVIFYETLFSMKKFVSNSLKFQNTREINQLGN